MNTDLAASGKVPGMLKRSGIYEILNTVNGKRYIGSAVSLKRRWQDHQKELRRGLHHNEILQRAWNKYGEVAFKFLPILTCAKSMLLFYEQQLLDKVKPEYNINPVAGSWLGRKHSPDAIRKISESKTGKRLTLEHRALLSTLLRGNTYTLGYKQTPEHIEKGRLARIGKKTGPRSAETCANISKALKGKKRGPKSDETRRKLSEALTGRQFSAEHIANITIAQRKRPPRPRGADGRFY